MLLPKRAVVVASRYTFRSLYISVGDVRMPDLELL